MRFFILFSLVLLLSTGCANKKIQSEVNQEMAKAPTVKSEDELYLLENKMLTDNVQLTPDQRINLHSLIQKIKYQNIAIDTEIGKTKQVLFQNLIKNRNNRAKLNVLESQLLKLNRKKVRYSLSAYREARDILGKNNVPLEKTLQMIDNRTKHEF